MIIRLGIFLGLTLGGVPAASPAPAPPGPTLSPQLARARLDAARRAYEACWARLCNREGVGPEKLYLWSRRWMEAQQALGGAAAEHAAAAQAHLNRMRLLEEFFTSLAKTGQGTQADASASAYYRVEAAIWLGLRQGQ